MAGIVILLIIAGCAVLQFFKGTVVRAFASIIVAICAFVAAFSFFGDSVKSKIKEQASSVSEINSGTGT